MFELINIEDGETVTVKSDSFAVTFDYCVRTRETDDECYVGHYCIEDVTNKMILEADVAPTSANATEEQIKQAFDYLAKHNDYHSF